MRFFSPPILSRLIVKLIFHSPWARNTKDLIVISHSHETELLLSIKDTSLYSIKQHRQSRDSSWISCGLPRSPSPVSDTLWPTVIEKVCEWSMCFVKAPWAFKLWNMSILYPDYYKAFTTFPKSVCLIMTYILDFLPYEILNWGHLSKNTL